MPGEVLAVLLHKEKKWEKNQEKSKRIRQKKMQIAQLLCLRG